MFTVFLLLLLILIRILFSWLPGWLTGENLQPLYFAVSTPGVDIKFTSSSSSIRNLNLRLRNVLAVGSRWFYKDLLNVFVAHIYFFVLSLSSLNEMKFMKNRKKKKYLSNYNSCKKFPSSV